MADVERGDGINMAMAQSQLGRPLKSGTDRGLSAIDRSPATIGECPVHLWGRLELIQLTCEWYSFLLLCIIDPECLSMVELCLQITA